MWPQPRRQGRANRLGASLGRKRSMAEHVLTLLGGPPLGGEGELKNDPRLVADGPSASVGGWTKTRPGSLGLLPSGPDPVGERYVLRQPPAAYVDHETAGRKRRAPSAPPCPPLRPPSPAPRPWPAQSAGGIVGGEQHLQRKLGKRHVVRRAENGDGAEERRDSEAGGDAKRHRPAVPPRRSSPPVRFRAGPDRLRPR